jgi:hypothetical protein
MHVQIHPEGVGVDVVQAGLLLGQLPTQVHVPLTNAFAHLAKGDAFAHLVVVATDNTKVASDRAKRHVEVNLENCRSNRMACLPSQWSDAMMIHSFRSVSSLCQEG